jgi:hypothetical protein
VRGRSTAGRRAFSGCAASSTILAYSPRKPILPGLALGGRCKIIDEVSTEDGRLFNYPVHLSSYQLDECCAVFCGKLGL